MKTLLTLAVLFASFQAWGLDTCTNANQLITYRNRSIVGCRDPQTLVWEYGIAFDRRDRFIVFDMSVSPWRKIGHLSTDEHKGDICRYSTVHQQCIPSKGKLTVTIQSVTRSKDDVQAQVSLTGTY